jgi:hypothetical protein
MHQTYIRSYKLAGAAFDPHSQLWQTHLARRFSNESFIQIYQTGSQAWKLKCALEKKRFVPVDSIFSISTNCCQFFITVNEYFFGIIQSRKAEQKSRCQLPEVLLSLRVWLCEQAQQKRSIWVSLKPLRQPDRIACFRFGNDIWRLEFRYRNTNLRKLEIPALQMVKH